VYDAGRGIEYKRSVDMPYFIAGWSPTKNEIAVYTPETRVTKIINLNGDLLHELDYTLGDFAWSPDCRRRNFFLAAGLLGGYGAQRGPGF
jgi:hypothetical protein